MGTTKVNIPKKIKVGCLDYKIKYPYVFDESNLSLRGQHCGFTSLIKLAGDSSNQIIVETLLHEIIHAVDFIFCANAFSEGFVALFSNGLFQVLRDNDLYLNTQGKIPSRVKISGFTYKVKNYKFVDSSSFWVSTLCQDSCEFRVKFYDDTDGKYSNNFIKFNLINLVCAAICNICCDYTFPENLDLRIFSNGLFQVLYANKLNELVRGIKC